MGADSAMTPIRWDLLQENLVTHAEIARRLDLTKSAPTTWQRTEDWPSPVMTFDGHSSTGEIRFYWWPDILAWCDRHQVTPGQGMPRGAPRGPRKKPPPPPGEELLTRSEMAARRDVNVSTMMGWIDRYPDFPAPARTDTPQPLWSWPAVKAYLDKKGLPKMRRTDAGAAAAERDKRILTTLGLYPDGLTERELADLLAADEPASARFGQPTGHAIEVRISDRLRRLETAGTTERTIRPGARRGVTVWRLLPAVSTG